MQTLSDALVSQILNIASVLLVPTVLLLILRRLIPGFGDALWRGYCQLLTWMVVLPVRLIRLLILEAAGRRGRRRP
ncbi:hypothetical protein [Paractinoplanes brasiliensis]|uniref:Uncharacterized protein n=1 Tax=Paractinoplanes brasiliensis TaxID=52695 RepID=A0A4V3C7Z8_9ACTN|nr:hypothetical protein [Actinoplanes brasiliensis]TDO39698.1 hypothetical protein C8E87_3394 [Actinoplanes brasiliensis]GID28965.1 hypothetical protein Abr02nite_39480 [Actinoplanes brasiliensis]